MRRGTFFIKRFGRSHIYRSLSRSSNDSLATLEELLLMTPHDVEKELHKIKRKMSSLFQASDYPAALECVRDLEVKVNAIMGKKNVGDSL